jgi:hypothetical protein
VSIIKSVPNLIFYLHEFFQIFSQSLAICFELFSIGVIFNSEITDSGPHLSGAGPARQRAAAAWLPRAARLTRALRRCRDSRPRARPTAPPSLRRLVRAAIVPTASPTAPPSQPKPRPSTPRRRPSSPRR